MCEKSGIFISNSVPTYRTRTITKKAHRTNVPYPYYYKKDIPYQRTVLLSKNWGVPYCHPCSRTALFFEPLKFCWKTPETSRKICKHLFCFPQLEHRLSQAGLPPQLKFHRWQKCDKKAYCFFSFFLAFFAYTSSDQQYWKPGAPEPLQFNFCQPI